MKKENKALLVDLRNHHTAREGETFAEYFQSLADEAAWLLINQRLGLLQPQAKFDSWRRDPEKTQTEAASSKKAW